MIGTFEIRPVVGLPSPRPAALCWATSSVLRSLASARPVRPNSPPSRAGSVSHTFGSPPPGGTFQMFGPP